MTSFIIFLRRRFKKMINRYALRVSPCIMSRLIFIGGIIPKLFSANNVVWFLYMCPIISTTFKRGSLGLP